VFQRQNIWLLETVESLGHLLLSSYLAIQSKLLLVDLFKSLCVFFIYTNYFFWDVCIESLHGIICIIPGLNYEVETPYGISFNCHYCSQTRKPLRLWATVSVHIIFLVVTSLLYVYTLFIPSAKELLNLFGCGTKSKPWVGSPLLVWHLRIRPCHAPGFVSVTLFTLAKRGLLKYLL
jgi:hypothetical protein